MIIALFHSVPFEAATVIKRLSDRRRRRCPKTAVFGSLGKAGVICVETGVGKANAAMSAALVLQQYKPDMVIMMGVGGAYPDAGLRVGDIAVAACEIYADEGVASEANFLTLRDIGIPFYKKGEVELYNTMPTDEELTRQLFDIARSKCENAQTGAFLTVSTCTGTKLRADELVKRYGGICENMEGAAVAHVSAIFGTPAVEIRGISNIAADRDRDGWELERASQMAQEAVIMLIENVKLPRRSKRK
ncbi:MAG: futalosine hydrolase [Candidatus Magnetominusculus sp. LBB02]|nr:futalosine hydrolase [Candidatus Magnetominusculus sp. LBB02]